MNTGLSQCDQQMEMLPDCAGTILCTAVSEIYLSRGICHCATVAVILRDTLMVMMASAPRGKEGLASHNYLLGVAL